MKRRNMTIVGIGMALIFMAFSISWEDFDRLPGERWATKQEGDG